MTHTWRVAETGTAHAFAVGSSRGVYGTWSLCARMSLVKTRLGRVGEAIRPCKHCTHRIDESNEFFKLIVKAGKW